MSRNDGLGSNEIKPSHNVATSETVCASAQWTTSWTSISSFEHETKTSLTIEVSSALPPS